MGRPLSATCAVLLLLLLLCCSQLQAQELARRCWKRCPVGEQCKVERQCRSYHCTTVEVCVKPPSPPTPLPSPPSSCQDVRCPGAADGSEVCVLQEVICFAPPCHPIPVCIQNQCALTFCGEAGTRCVTLRKPGSQPACTPFPACQFTSACVPRAKPKPGFCPAPEQVSNANVNQCDYDNDCPSDLLCCPGTSRGGRNCTAPAYPNPCDTITCPPAPDIVGGTCLVRNGVPSCADRVCQPGSFFCRDGKQCYCSDGGEIICTTLPAPPNCNT